MLFDKEAILQYIITKKNEYSRKLKEYERLKKEDENEQSSELTRQQNENVKNFVKFGKPVNGENPTTSRDASSSSSSLSNMANGNASKLPSFWVPSECPNAGRAKVEKPDPTIYCPVSQKPLRAKDLIDVKFTLVADRDNKKSLIAKEARYMCPITHDILSNAVPCAVLRPT